MVIYPLNVVSQLAQICLAVTGRFFFVGLQFHSQGHTIFPQPEDVGTRIMFVVRPGGPNGR